MVPGYKINTKKLHFYTPETTQVFKI
jgi:hypothetical protein